MTLIPDILSDDLNALPKDAKAQKGPAGEVGLSSSPGETGNGGDSGPMLGALHYGTVIGDERSFQPDQTPTGSSEIRVAALQGNSQNFVQSEQASEAAQTTERASGQGQSSIAGSARHAARARAAAAPPDSANEVAAIEVPSALAVEQVASDAAAAAATPRGAEQGNMGQPSQAERSILSERTTAPDVLSSSAGSSENRTATEQQEQIRLPQLEQLVGDVVSDAAPTPPLRGGTDGDDIFVATAIAERFSGGTGSDTVS